MRNRRFENVELLEKEVIQLPKTRFFFTNIGHMIWCLYGKGFSLAHFLCFYFLTFKPARTFLVACTTVEVRQKNEATTFFFSQPE